MGRNNTGFWARGQEFFRMDSFGGSRRSGSQTLSAKAPALFSRGPSAVTERGAGDRRRKWGKRDAFGLEFGRGHPQRWMGLAGWDGVHPQRCVRAVLNGGQRCR